MQYAADTTEKQGAGQRRRQRRNAAGAAGAAQSRRRPRPSMRDASYLEQNDSVAHLKSQVRNNDALSDFSSSDDEEDPRYAGQGVSRAATADDDDDGFIGEAFLYCSGPCSCG